MNELTKEQIKRRLEKAFGGDSDQPLEFFNITPLYEVSRMLNLLRENKRWDALYAAHTVRFEVMSERERIFLALNLVNYFGMPEDPEAYRDGTRLRQALSLAQEKKAEDPFDDVHSIQESENNDIGFDI